MVVPVAITTSFSFPPSSISSPTCVGVEARESGGGGGGGATNGLFASSQLGTPLSPPLQLGFDDNLLDLPGEVGDVAVEISGPSSSSTAVPSNVFVFNFGLPRSLSDADNRVGDVEMAIAEEDEVGDGGGSV